MTPVDEAVERVREDLAHADAQGHHALLMPIEDLRALLSALELGSVANASREGSTEPATPSDVELLRDQFALIGKLAGSGTLKQNGRPYPKWKAVSEEAEAGRAKADAMLSKGLKCAVCGSTKTDSEIEAGGWIACCPERRMVSALSASTTDSGKGNEPVAWRVKDFADGWTLHYSLASAKREAEGAGNLIQPLFRIPPPPAPPTGEGGGL